MNPLSRLLVFSIAAVSLSSTVSNGAFLPVCERTPQVKTNLESQTGRKCEAIVESDLLSIDRVAVRRGIQSFKADDFSGLRNLTILNIRSNPYTQLPEGFFDDLENLKTLVIISTGLSSFPIDFLVKTPNLENLHAFRNKVNTLSDEVIERFANLKSLRVVDLDKTIQNDAKQKLTEALSKSVNIQFR